MEETAENQQGLLAATLQALKDKEYTLKERVKELNCLYSVSQCVRRTDISRSEIFHLLLDMIVQGYQYPDIAACRIVFENQEFCTENYVKTQWSQASPIRLKNESVGSLEVCYLQERPEEDESSFFAQERRLLDALADLIGKSTERRQAEEELTAANIKLQALWTISSLTDLDTFQIYDYIIESIAPMTNSKFGFFRLINEDESIMTIYRWSGKAMENCAIDEKPLDYPIESAGIWGEAVRQRNTFIMNDYSAPHPGKKGLPSGHVPLTRLLVVPGFLHGRITAVAAVANKETDYNENDVNQLSSFIQNVNLIINTKLSQEALEKAQAQLNRFFDVVPDLICIASADGYFKTLNPAWEKILGFTQAELMAEPFVNFIHPDDVEPTQREVERQIGEQTTIYFINRYRCKDGSYKSLEWVSAPAGKGRDLFAVARDITDRLRVDRELLINQERLLRAQSIAHIGNWEWFPPTNQLFWQEENYRIFGLPLDEPPSVEKFINTIHPEDREFAQDRIAKALRGEEPYDIDLRIIRTDGQERFIHATGEVDFDQEKNPLRFFGTVQDITERKRSEQEMQRLQTQLGHSQKMEAIGTLAGGIAHDFNNLLTGILGQASLLKIQSHSDPAVYSAADLIERTAERAAELTQQLLGFARRGKYQVQPVNINKTIADVVRLLGRTIDKRISIIQLPAPGDPAVKGDPGQMQQVLMNLALNARDAMPNGGELVFQTAIEQADQEFCLTHTGVKPGRYLEIAVSDSGQGIAPENLTRIFEPFFTTKEQGKGTGMGLAMVYGIVQNHGGFIDLESELGRGSTFRIYLPLDETQDAERTARVDETAQNGSGRILLVDDENIIRTVGTDILNSLGYSVTGAADGAEAVKIYSKEWQNIDLVILDMIMPNLNGRDCFRELKKINPNIKAILSSGYGLESRSQEILDEGVMGFIQKPYRVDQLSKIITEVLQSKKFQNSLMPTFPKQVCIS